MLAPHCRRFLSTFNNNKFISTASPLQLKKFNFRSFASSSQLSAFDERWKKLTQAEKDLVAKEYEHLQKGDWKSLTIDQKRIRRILNIGGNYIKRFIFIF